MDNFNLAILNERLAEKIPERECLVFGDLRLTYAAVAERSRRLADYLRQRGLGKTGDRSQLPGWSSGQDHVALYLMNGNEYIEGMLGSFKSRTVPINVNYRYVEEELIYLLRDARARAVIYHSRFAESLAKVLPETPDLEVLIQVADESGADLLPGAIWYDKALEAGSPAPLSEEPQADDLYALYTGGTTGMPKGVLWRQHDIFMAAMGGRRRDGSGFVADHRELLETAENEGMRVLAAPPFMHGAGHWLAFITLHGGGTLLIQNVVDRLDPHDLLATIEREKVNLIVIVGDAFGRPLLDAIREGDYDLSSLFAVANGGAPLSVTVKEALLEELPHALIMDGIGSSETGQQGMHTSSRDGGAATGQFTPVEDTCVVDEDLEVLLKPGSDEVGWFAKAGHVPLGYLDDEAKTRKTFPEIDGRRYAVPGDRARHLADGTVEVLGRDSVTINSGGEKIFAEEVEQALLAHPAVYDAVVAGRKSLRWGQEVVAVVQLKKGAEASTESLLEECSRHIARYKLAKDFVFSDAIQRSPSGKADYRWARALVGDN